MGDGGSRVQPPGVNVIGSVFRLEQKWLHLQLCRFPLHRLRPVSPPGHKGYGRCRSFPFQTMSKAGVASTCPGDDVEKIDIVQFLIDKFDSDDSMTSVVAVGVDEDIIAELTRRGHVRKEQINLMEVAIHHLNRGVVIGNSMNLNPMVENLTK